MENLLKDFGYNYTRISAIPLKHMINRNETFDLKTAIIRSLTSSHLQSIYTAVRDYELKDLNYKKNVHYALIMEDDPHFLFDIRDWKGLIESAPPDWSILQLTTHCTSSLESFFNTWSNFNKLWVRRGMNDFSTATYLVNMESPIIRKLFSNPTNDEKASIDVRLDHTKLFTPMCNHSDLSMSSRLGCKAFGHRSRDFERYKSATFSGEVLRKKVRAYEDGFISPADYFIYNIGEPHAYISTISLFGFEQNLISTINSKSKVYQLKGIKTILKLAQLAVKNGKLPSYLSSTLCSIPILEPSTTSITINATSFLAAKKILATNPEALENRNIPPLQLKVTSLFKAPDLLVSQAPDLLVLFFYLCISLLIVMSVIVNLVGIFFGIRGHVFKNT